MGKPGLRQVPINAVNMPPLTPEEYKVLGPYISVTERLAVLRQ